LSLRAPQLYLGRVCDAFRQVSRLRDIEIISRQAQPSPMSKPL